MFETLSIRAKDHVLTEIDTRRYHSLDANYPLECLDLIKHLHLNLKASLHDVPLRYLNVVDELYDLTTVVEDKTNLLPCRCEYKISYSSVSNTSALTFVCFTAS